MSNRSWTNHEEQYLRENYYKFSKAAIAEQLGKTEKAVRSRAKLLKITVSRKYPEEQLQIVRDMYADTATEEIAKRIGRTVTSVYQMAAKLGLKKSPEYLSRILQLEAERLRAHGEKTRFVKGQRSWNKGKQMPFNANSAATQFKKGVRGNKWKPVGSERVSVDGYVEVKVAEPRKWDLKHRMVWRENFGEIPKGHAVVFKDRNPLNCVPENLELITRQELMSRNTIQNWPEPLKGLIHQIAGFNRKLNKRKRDYGEKQNTGSAEPAVRNDGEVDGRRRSDGSAACRNDL